jgi:hypothetical protein
MPRAPRSVGLPDRLTLLVRITPEQVTNAASAQPTPTAVIGWLSGSVMIPNAPAAGSSPLALGPFSSRRRSAAAGIPPWLPRA